MVRNVTLLGSLTGALAALPDRPDAVAVAGAATSREGLLAAAEAVAARVRGARAVAVEGRADLRTVVAVTGCLLAGVPAVPVPPDAGPAARAHLLADSGADVALAPDDIDLGDRTSSPVGPEPDGDSTALVLYTSGTTGPPKGVPVTRAAIAACLDGLADAWAWDADDVLVHGLPLFHVHGLVLGVLGPLRTGSRLVHTGRPTAEAYAGAAAGGGTLFFGVPTVWSRVGARPAAARALRPARLLVSGSAGLPTATSDRVTALTGHRPVERYGMTETLITLATRAHGDPRRGTVGRPLPGVTTRLVEGELEVAGPSVFAGYLNRPGAADFTPDGWFRTGDVATVDADGRHRIVGRTATDLIKSGGHRIGAGEVEDSLLGAPGVREVAVVGSPDDDLGEVVTAYVVADGPTDAGTGRRLVEHVAADLGAHKRPRRVRFVAELPRSALGKVLKTELRGRAGGG